MNHVYVVIYIYINTNIGKCIWSIMYLAVKIMYYVCFYVIRKFYLDDIFHN